MTWKTLAAFGIPALLLLGVASPVAQADLITNGGFESVTNSPKGYFPTVGPTGWQGGGGLTFVDAPGTADDGSYLSVYKPFPNQSPNGGNFVEADGNPEYSGVIYQKLNGLTPGQVYAVSFFQAAGQQQGFANGSPTTEQWWVNLSDSLDPMGVGAQLSSLMTTPSGGVTPWQSQTLSFTADSTSMYLSFLAWGDGGSTVNLPPIVFLDGVSVTTTVPEPTSLAAMGLVLLGLGVSYRRQRAARSAAV